jgi:hypothetical protein
MSNDNRFKVNFLPIVCSTNRLFSNKNSIVFSKPSNPGKARLELIFLIGLLSYFINGDNLLVCDILNLTK